MIFLSPSLRRWSRSLREPPRATFLACEPFARPPEQIFLVCEPFASNPMGILAFANPSRGCQSCPSRLRSLRERRPAEGALPFRCSFGSYSCCSRFVGCASSGLLKTSGFLPFKKNYLYAKVQKNPVSRSMLTGFYEIFAEN